MSQATILYRRAIKVHEREFGAVITWAGGDYPCAPGVETDTKTTEIDGFALGADLVVAIRRDLLPSIPQLKQSVSYLRAAGETAKTYRIDSVVNPPGAAFVQLGLVDPNRGA